MRATCLRILGWLARNPGWVVLTAIILIVSTALYCQHKYDDSWSWEAICSSEGQDLGYEKTTYYAKDRPRGKCFRCALHPELKLKEDPRIVVKAEPNILAPLKEKVLECDCQQRRYWIQAIVEIGHGEWQNLDFDWKEVTPEGVDERLLNYACRNWKEDDRRVDW